MGTHARLSPSDKAWPNCPGSVRENAAYPDIPGDAAISGTGSHLLLEMCLRAGVRADSYVGQLIGVNHEDCPGGWNVDEERAVRVQMCLDYVATRVKQLKQIYPDCKVVVEAESKSNPGGLVGRTDWHGTCDITISVTNSHKFCVYLEVIDYKDGREWVDVHDNTQLQAYLFGKMRPYIGSGPELVRPFYPERVNDTRQTIVQPKCTPPVRYVDASGTEAFAVFDDLSWAAAQTDFKNAPLIPDGKKGKGHCRWCKHGRAGNCSALNNNALSEANSVSQVTVTGSPIFEMTTVADIKQMDDDAISKLYDREAAVMQVFAHVKEEITARVLQRGMDGFVMGDGRGSNVYAVKEEEVVKRLKSCRMSAEDIYQKKLISPAALMEFKGLSKQQRDKLKEELIVFKAGEKNKTLVRVAYERPTLTPEQMFGGAAAPAQLPDFSGASAMPNFLAPALPSFL